MAAHADEVERALGRALTRLYERVPLGMRLGLGPMKEACVRAGHPERSFPCVHVAGTNGKGSVSALIEGAARAAGKKTGLYTSPHLARFAERIRIDGIPIDDATLAVVLEEALHVGYDLSFFETATLAAFLAFRAAGVSFAVLEVGLGGRFDATNVIEAPLCTVVTRIAFDHEDRLGNTLAQIALEKAGIAKSDTPMVVGHLDEEARASLVRVATAAGARLRHVDDERRIEGDARDLPSPPGKYQRKNVEIALLACRVLGLEAHARSGFSRVVWPGRFEWLDTPSGPFLLDAAHNPDGAEGLVASIDAALAEPPSAWPPGASLAGRPRALVFGSLADKSYATTLPIVSRIADAGSRFYSVPKGRVAAHPEDLARLVPGTPCANLHEALLRARDAVGPSGVVVVCGSVYLVGEARAALTGESMDPPVAL